MVTGLRKVRDWQRWQGGFLRSSPSAETFQGKISRWRQRRNSAWMRRRFGRPLKRLVAEMLQRVRLVRLVRFGCIIESFCKEHPALHVLQCTVRVYSCRWFRPRQRPSMLSRRQKEQRRRGNFWQFLRTEKLQNPVVERTDLRWIPLSTAEPRLSKFKRRQICDTSQPFWTYFKICQNMSKRVTFEICLNQFFVTFCHDILMPWSPLISPGSCSGEETPGQGRGTQQQQQRIDASMHRFCLVLFLWNAKISKKVNAFIRFQSEIFAKNTWKHMKTTRFCWNAGSRGCPTGCGCQGERWCAVLMRCDKRSQSPWAKMIMAKYGKHHNKI